MGTYRRTVAALVAVGAVLAGQLVGVASATAATGAASSWSSLDPAARSDASMVYDPALGQLVLFGGLDANDNLLGDTWIGNGTTWTEATPSSSPSARSDYAMAYDPALGEIVLFGGLTALSNTSAVADTWAFNGTTWTALTPAASPPARSYASMAFDPSLGAHGELVLFGGLSPSGTALGDTYAFDGTTWSTLTPAPSPSPRSDASMAYDAASSQLVLFGGINASSTPLAETWTFNGTTWTQASPTASPPARSDAAMDYDPATSQLVLFGGVSTTTTADTWTYNGTTWTQLTPATSPPGRNSAAFAYDPATGELVLFGGLDVNANTLGDVWLSNATTWVEAASPPARSDYAMANDPALGGPVLFGGLASDGVTALADTWAYNGTSWVQKVPTASPPARSFASMAYDQASGQMVLYGGLAANGATALGDTWVYNGTTWTELTPPVTPGPRSDASLTYDAALGELVLFGGLDSNSNTLSDTWTFNGTTWTPMGPPARSDYASAFDSATNQLVIFGGLDVNDNTIGDTWVETGSTWKQVTGPGPAARSYASMVYDAAIGKVVLFGGLAADGVTALGDTWEFNGTSWLELATPNTPQARSDAMLVYDSSLGEPVLFGGITNGGAVQQDTWLFAVNNNWQKLVLGTKPPARSDAAMAYDTAANQVVLFGGLDSTGVNTLDDTWEFNGSRWSQALPSTSPPARSYPAMAYDASTNQVVLYGGLDPSSNTLADEWTFNPATGTWAAQTTATLPSARSDTSMVYNSSTSQLFLFGGLDPNVNTLGDTWIGSGTSWVAQSPPPRSDAAMAFDAASNAVVLFGGLDVNSSTVGDTWTYTGTTWSEVSSPNAPSARAFTAMAYDPATGNLVLFGGLDNNLNTLGDAWTFASGGWTAQTPPVLPGARSDYAMTEDTTANQLVLFGGLDVNGEALGDTWVLTTTVAQTVGFTSSAPISETVGGPTYTPTASATSGLPVVITLDPSSSGCSLAGGVVTFTTVGTCVIDANQPGNATYPAAPQVQQSVTVDPATQAIAFTPPASGTVGNTAPLAATGGASGNPVVFTVDPSTAPGVCSVSGNDGTTLDLTGAGTCVVDANQAGSTNYSAAPQVQQSVTVAPATQTITFPAPAAGTVGTAATLAATGGASGNPVVFTVDPSTAAGVCAVSGTDGITLTFTGTGTCVIDANQAGDANYLAAPQVQQGVTVAPGSQSIAFTPPASGTVGTTATLAATGGASGDPVVFTVDPSNSAGVCSVSGTDGITLSFTGSGTCVIDANQAGNANYLAAPQVQQSVTVAPATQAIAFTPPAPGTVGDTATLAATGGVSGNPVVFTIDPSTAAGVCSVSGVDGTTLDFTGAGTCVIDANQAGNANYSAAPQVQQSVTVAPASQSIAFTPPSSGTVGTAGTLAATGGGSGNPVVFTVDPSTAAGVCSVSGIDGTTLTYGAIGTCVVDANQAGNANYLAAPQVQQSITVTSLCSPGSYSATGSVPCTSAPAGTYVSSTGATSPTPCPSGTYTLSAGATSAAACVTLAVVKPGNRHNYIFAAVAAAAPSVVNALGAVTWSGSGLPAGIVLSPTTGALSGTPTTPCSCSVTLVATDAHGHSASTTFAWTILAFGIATASLPQVVPGAPYGPVQLSAGGVAPNATLKWTKGAPLPRGLKLTKTGVISGTASSKLVAGSATASITVTETVITRVGTRRVKTKTTVRTTIALPIA